MGSVMSIPLTNLEAVGQPHQDAIDQVVTYLVKKYNPAGEKWAG